MAAETWISVKAAAYSARKARTRMQRQMWPQKKAGAIVRTRAAQLLMWFGLNDRWV